MRPDAAAQEAGEAMAQGFCAVKLKLGAGAHRDDLAAIRAVRGAIGRAAELMVDYNQSLSVDEALARVPAIDGEDLACIEEPTRAGDYRGHARIAAAAQTPIQLGENWWGPENVQESIAAGASDQVTLDVMKLGGVRGWLTAAALAADAALPASSHTFPELSAHLLAFDPDLLAPRVPRPRRSDPHRTRPGDGRLGLPVDAAGQRPRVGGGTGAAMAGRLAALDGFRETSGPSPCAFLSEALRFSKHMTTRPRIPPVEPPYDSATASMLQKWMPPGTGLEPLRLFRTLAVHESLAARMRPLGAGILGHGLLEPRIRELMILRTCARCGAEYEWGVHATFFGQTVGLTESELAATVHADAQDVSWSAQDRAVIRAADELHDSAGVSDTTFADLRRHFTAPEILELVVAAGWYHTIAFVINAARVEPESWAARWD
jgi:4-carboxymuconolactone decarboxylase